MQQETIQIEKIEEQVPVCGGNFTTPVTDVTDYLDEIHYTVGNIKYVENAD